MPESERSGGGTKVRSPSRRSARFACSYTSSQTHGFRSTSHQPSVEPPQAPFRWSFGQVIGQTYSVYESTQLPHSLQPNIGTFTACSTVRVSVTRPARRSIAPAARRRSRWTRVPGVGATWLAALKRRWRAVENRHQRRSTLGGS